MAIIILKLGKGFYVYKFLNEDNEIIYVGRAKDLERRIMSHMKGGSHLNLVVKDVASVKYTSFNTEVEMEIFEKYLIAKHLPILNSSEKLSSEVSSNIKLEFKNKIEWEDFEFHKTGETYESMGHYTYYDKDLDVQVKLKTSDLELEKNAIFVIRKRLTALNSEVRYYIEIDDSDTIIYSDSIFEATTFESLDSAVKILVNLNSDWEVIRYYTTEPNKSYHINWEYYEYKRKT